MSELRKNENFDDGSNKPELCVNCHEFFGNAYTESLCSKCFRTKSKDTADKTQQATTLINQVTTLATQTEDKISAVAKDGKPALEESKAEKVEMKPEEQSTGKQVDHTRCFQCTKKVGLLGFKCQCESTFCRTHRLPETHECGFDFGKAGKDRLAKENLVVKADKVQRF